MHNQDHSQSLHLEFKKQWMALFIVTRDLKNSEWEIPVTNGPPRASLYLELNVFNPASLFRCWRGERIALCPRCTGPISSSSFRSVFCSLALKNYLPWLVLLAKPLSNLKRVWAEQRSMTRNYRQPKNNMFSRLPHERYFSFVQAVWATFCIIKHSYSQHIR